jgi:glycosyltransferase involved in cell wall biosynthesis
VGDIEDMAANALKILKDDATLTGFKKRALEQAKKFDLNLVLDQYIKMYQAVMVKSKAAVV